MNHLNDRRYNAATAALGHRLLKRFRTAWVSTSRAIKRSWTTRMILGTVLTALFTAGVTVAGRRLERAGALDWERDFLRWLQEDFFIGFGTAMWIEIPGNTIVALPVTVMAAGFAIWYFRPLRALTMLVGFVVFKLIVLEAWTIWDRPRPEIIRSGIASPEGYFDAYPSGHVVQVLFVYGFLVYLWIRSSRSTLERILAVLLLVLITTASAIGRMRVGAHWPTDIIAGLLIGLFFLAAVLYALHDNDVTARPRSTS